MWICFNKYKKKFHIYYLENGEFVRTEDEIVNEKWRKKWTNVEQTNNKDKIINNS